MQRATNQWKSQWQTLQHFPVKTDSNIAVDEYNVIVDALFGVGLSRPVEGSYADAVKEMNMTEGFKLALDVPSAQEVSPKPDRLLRYFPYQQK